MAVVEVGTWCVRAGYVGDPVCTRSPRALCARACPEEMDFMSTLHAASARGPGELVALWSLSALQADPALHMRHLHHLKYTALGCTTEDALALVVPEIWHEDLKVMSTLVAGVFDEAGLTSRLYCGRPSVCWALAHGCASAVVLDVGHSHTTVAAVLDGYALRRTVASVPVGGAAVTAQFAALLADPSHAQRDAAGGTVDWVSSLLAAYPHIRRDAAAWGRLREDAVSDVKHGYGYVQHEGVDEPAAAHDVDNGSHAAGADTTTTPPPPPHVPLRLPDGGVLRLDAVERTRPFEVLFAAAPSCCAPHTEIEQGGVNVAAMLVRCKQQLDVEWQARTVLHVLAGAGGRVPGFRARLVAEARARDAAYFRYEANHALQVARSAEGAWAGAAIAAASSSFSSLWISRAEWEEEGTGVLCRKLLY